MFCSGEPEIGIRNALTKAELGVDSDAALLNLVVEGNAKNACFKRTENPYLPGGFGRGFEEYLRQFSGNLRAAFRDLPDCSFFHPWLKYARVFSELS